MAVTANGTPYVESSDLVANYPGVSLALANHIDDLPAAVLQVVRATDTTLRSTTSTSFVDASISVTITPQKSTSVILIMAFFGGESTWLTEATNQRAVYQITDSSNNAISGAEASYFGRLRASAGATVRAFNASVVLNAYATPATTSPVTYKLRFRIEASGNTASVRNADSTGQMYAIEVSA